MTKVGSTERTNDLGLVGGLGKAYQYGEKIYGDVFYGDEEIYPVKSEYGARIYGDFFYGETGNIWGIYQRRHAKGKKIYARLKFYIPSNPQTPTQQIGRNKFKNGMTAWGNFTNEQKNVYNERAKKKHLHGVNLFLREYLKS